MDTTFSAVMIGFLVVLLLLAVAVGTLAYSRGWSSVTKKKSMVGVQIDPEKFKNDKEAFSKSFREKARAMKGQVANLWQNSERRADDDKAHVQKELGELKKKHDQLEERIEELEDADHHRFENIKRDLSKTVEELEKKIDEMTKKLENGKNK